MKERQELESKTKTKLGRSNARRSCRVATKFPDMVRQYGKTCLIIISPNVRSALKTRVNPQFTGYSFFYEWLMVKFSPLEEGEQLQEERVTGEIL